MIDIDTTLWKSLLFPILAAILTTLAVEYFAKPWLEARKERLIRNRQQIDEVIFQFQKVSGSMAALLPDNLKHPLKERHNEAMRANARDGLYGILEAISRLPHRYAEKHSNHISKTMLFIGYLIAHVENGIGTHPLSVEARKVDSLKAIASDLQYFDVYFLANVSSNDSQEKWYRRVYWNQFSKKEASQETETIIKKHKLGERG